MTKLLCTIIALLVLLTACSGNTRPTSEPTEYAHIPYTSAITPAECFVCGEQEGSMVKAYWGEDNIGVLDLNTFEFIRLEINRYDDSRSLIEEAAGFLQRQSMKCGESYVHASIYPDRGYAHIQIQGQRQPIDAAAIQNHLCQTCLDTINNTYFGDSPPEEYAIIDFADKTIHLLLRHTIFFTSENYGIDCEFKASGDIDLLAFYCPLRYE